MYTPWPLPHRGGTIAFTMETGQARAIAERLHRGDREDDGTPVIRHLRRVATAVPEEARAVAWLHEVLEWTAVTEQELLIAGLTSDELRALRLLSRTTDSRADSRYLAHLDLIAHANGDSGRLARIVKTADLEDRSLHPYPRRDGWFPPYAQALMLLSEARDDPYRVATAAGA